MEIIAQREWQEIIEELTAERGTAILVGSTDTGKSTLAKYLTWYLTMAGISVSLVDADIGQSSLGLPGSVSFKTFRSTADVNDFSYERFSFIGSASPSPVVPFLIKETLKFVALGRTSAAITLVDTTGLVSDELGRRLKIEKIRAIRPDLIIAIEKDVELKHILELVEDIPIIRLNPSPLAKTRSWGTRSRYRSAKFAEYFNNTREFLFASRSIEFFRHGSAVSHEDARMPAGTVIGLNRDEETMGLGIVTESDPDSITLKTPLSSLRGIRRVIFGNITAEING
jgi:polynucleotide 5'-hydroxyl-kinase GRC3/NOL9